MSAERTIWKFPLQVAVEQRVTMPLGAVILSAQFQADTLCVWALVAPDNDKEQRTLLICGTGHEVPRNVGRFIDTVQTASGMFVWHIFEGNQ